MPAVAAPAKVLVTGANGFIAVATVKAFIEHGFHVIGAVRTAPKGEYLKNLFPKNFEYTVVPDIEKPDAYDDAVKLGPAAIAHMASPVILGGPDADPKLVIGPAVTGTTGILHSVLKYGLDSVKRVVITSSAASLLEPKDGPYTFTEADWNNYSAELVEKEGSAAGGSHIYRASKVLAERAAWAFMEANKGVVKFELVTLLPPLVFGPIYQETTNSPSSLNETSAVFLKQITNPPPPAPGIFSGNAVDVRDIALAHVLAVKTEKAGGERIIVSGGPFTWEGFRDELLKANIKGVAPGSAPGAVPAPPQIIVDGSKAESLLGLKYSPRIDTLVDAIKSIYERFPDVGGKA